MEARKDNAGDAQRLKELYEFDLDADSNSGDESKFNLDDPPAGTITTIDARTIEPPGQPGHASAFHNAQVNPLAATI